MNYYIKIDNAIPVGPVWPELNFTDQFPDIDVNNLPVDFLRVDFINPPSDLINYKLEFVIDGDVVKMIYTTL